MTSQNAGCSAVREDFALYLYGELSFDLEERVESHLDACEACRAALAEQRELHAALDGVAVEPSASMLWSARQNLRERLAEEAPMKVVRAGWWERFLDVITFRPGHSWMRPAGAMALIAIGFFGSKVVPGDLGGLSTMSLSNPGAKRVRSVEPGENGRIQIVLDETRRHTVTGALDDANIRALLLSAAKDPSDPGLQEDTLTILNSDSSPNPDLRDVLIATLEHDQNAGVRLKALEGLQSFARDREVQKTLAQVLLSDGNPGVRMQAIDLLTAGTETNFDRQVVGLLQELMSRESNDYIRERGQRLLETVKASSESY